MDETRYAKYTYTMVWGLKNGLCLTDAEIERAIANGIIEPVWKIGRQFYRYNPEQLDAYFFD